MVPDRGHGGYWRVVVAVVGCLIAYGSIAEPKSEGVGANPQNQAERDEAKPKRAAPPQYQDNGQTGGYRADCREPKDREDSDLCAQWGAVKSVRESNEIARSGLWLTGFEFFALIATLGATAWAAIAAGRAAGAADRAVDAAYEANKFSRDAYIVDQRPWLAHRRMLTRHPGDNLGDFFSFGIEWINGGKSPSAYMEIWNYFSYLDSTIKEDDLIYAFPRTGDRKVSLGPGLTCAGGFEPVSFEQLDAVLSGQKRLFICSRVEYRSLFEINQPNFDPATTPFHTEVCLEIKCKSYRQVGGGIEALFDHMPFGPHNTAS